MPRIRSIKPEFFSDERLITLPIATRFTFLGLICFADDDGYVTANHRSLASMIYHDAGNEMIDQAMAALMKLKRIERIVIDADDEEFGAWYRVVNFKKHQRIDKPIPSKITLALQQKVQKTAPETEQMGLSLTEQRSPVIAFWKTRYPQNVLSQRWADVLLEFCCRFDTDPRFIIVQKVSLNARDPIAYLARILDDNNPPLPRGAERRVYSWAAWEHFVNAATMRGEQK